MALGEPLRMREAVGDNGEEAATFDEPEGLKEAMFVI